MSDDIGYFDDPDPSTIGAEDMNHDGGGYYEDEWYEDDDLEPSEWSYWLELYKAPNGHLLVISVTGWKYAGQDWGETVDQWKEYYTRLGDLKPGIRKAAIEFGKTLKPGDSEHFYWQSYFPMIRGRASHPNIRSWEKPRQPNLSDIPF